MKLITHEVFQFEIRNVWTQVQIEKSPDSGQGLRSYKIAILRVMSLTTHRTTRHLH